MRSGRTCWQPTGLAAGRSPFRSRQTGWHATYWLLSEKSKRLACPTHIYVFVNLAASDSDHEYYVVPSRVVKRHMYDQTAKTGQKGNWHSFLLTDAEKYKDGWKLFGRARI
jgi:hypothetical protein